VRKKINLNYIRIYHFPWILAIVVVFFLVAGILLYRLVGIKTERMMVERVKAQEFTLARSGALSIAEFFKERKTELLLLAQVEAIRAGREKEAREAMQILVNHLEEGCLGDIVVVSREGKALWVTNVTDNRRGEGVSLADRDYFVWAKKQKEPGKVFISEPLIARGGIKKGEWSVVMAAPVFWKKHFNGLVFISFPLGDLTKKYVDPLVSLPATKLLIVSQDGTVVTATIEETIGENVLKHAQQEDWEGRKEYLGMIKKALAGEEGSLVHYYYLFAPYNKRLKIITAYTPIKIDNQIWSLWVSVPYSDVIKLVLPFRANQIGGVIFGLVLVMALVLVFVFGVRVAQRDGFMDGYMQARDEVDKKKK